MATHSSVLSNTHVRGWRPSALKKNNNFHISENFMYLTRGNSRKSNHVLQSSICCSALNIELFPAQTTLSSSQFSSISHNNVVEASEAASMLVQSLTLGDIDPATAKLAISILGPFLSAFAFLFILRIVMSWYPKLPVGKFPYVIAYAPTEPLLIPTRKVIPPVGGVDVTPVVWFGLLSFLNEILLGPQGLLVLLSQQVNG